jgi:uncharacterized protein YdeI (YjbR/CyaY-like superfamily)
MNITKTLTVVDRDDWRDWLRKHSKTEKEIWLIYDRKRTGRPRIPYNDAVDEALCFGWIDSTVKSLDEERLVQRFSPRNPKSAYSQANKERLRRMIARGRVRKDVAATLGNFVAEKFKIPADILKALKADKQAWENFRAFSGPYQRIRIAFINSARNRPAEFQKRLRHFLQMTGKNKLYGFGIETFY